MTFLTAVRYGVDAAVVYHGDDTEKYRVLSAGVRRPGAGGEDGFAGSPPVSWRFLLGLRLRQSSILTVRRQPRFDFDTDAIRSERSFHTMATFHREFVAFRGLLQT
jgi:hypothetical protein